MARAHRMALLGTAMALAYFLTIFNYLSVPLVSEELAGQIIPVVRNYWPSIAVRQLLTSRVSLFAFTLLHSI